MQCNASDEENYFAIKTVLWTKKNWPVEMPSYICNSALSVSKKVEYFLMKRKILRQNVKRYGTGMLKRGQTYVTKDKLLV
jgi:hypothetical protein